MDDLEKLRQTFIKSINRTTDRAFYLTQKPEIGNITNVISTQVPSFDRAIARDIHGRWGIPCGRATFIVGKPGTSKTTLCLHLCKETQRRGGFAFYINGEFRFDEPYAINIGVDTDKLIFCDPETVEEGIETIEDGIESIKGLVTKLTKTAQSKSRTAAAKKKREKAITELEKIMKVPILMAFDSTSLKTRAELGGSSELGGHARAFSLAMRKIIADVSKLNIALVFVCQQKNKINTGWSRGDNETWLAENAFRFHSTVGIKTMKIKTLTSGKKEDKETGDNKVGDMVKIIAIKNSLMPPFKTGIAELYYGKGFDYHISLCELLMKHYRATKDGQNYKLKELGLKWKGKAGLEEIMKDNKKARKIRKLLAAPPKRL